MGQFRTTIAAGLLAIAMPLSAKAQVVGAFTSTPAPLHIYNEFTSELTALSLTRTVSAGTSLTLTGNAVITFDLVGTGGGLIDTFTATGIPNFTEASYSDQNNFGFPVALGSAMFGPGSLSGELWFTNPLGRTVTVGDAGFGLYLPDGFTSGSELSTFYIGYDDERADLADSDFDDLVIRATVSQAVPEPATWTMLLIGFFAAGLSIRRHPLSYSSLAS